VRPDHGPVIDVILSRSMPYGWQAVHALVGPRASVVLDNADPGRDCFEHPILPSMDSHQVEVWTRAVGLAWAAARTDVPHLARGLDALVKAVVPIRSRPHRPPRAASSPNAFGAAALSFAEPQRLGILLVAQAARLTVAAVQHGCQTADPDGEASPHDLAVASGRGAALEFAAVAVRERGRSEDEFAPAGERTKLLRALDTLDSKAGWSEAGLLLLSGLRERVEGCHVR
jgi:hypothetical protein